MSLEDFQLLDNEAIDNSIIKRDFLKVCGLGGIFDFVVFNSHLILGLCLLECNLDFINVFCIYIN